MSYAITMSTLPLAGLRGTPQRIAKVAVRVVNRTTERARTYLARHAAKEVKFPANYLSQDSKRLFIEQRATESRPVAVIRARHRPTSLARFALGSRGKGGVNVSVAPGRRVNLPRAFFVKLRAGNLNIDTRFNLGLAIRLPDGQRPDSAYKPLKLRDNTWLLYGPSVDQVIRRLAPDAQADAREFMVREAERQLGLEF